MTGARDGLKTAIKEILDDMSAVTNKDEANELFATKIADAIDAYILSLTITVSGVATTGTSAAQTQSGSVKAKIS